METKQKLFAFKLAAKEDAKKEQVAAQWKARDGVAVAGCTDYKWEGNLRYASAQHVADRGIYC